MKCPWCGSENVDADFVDNGVGMQRCGPYGCEDCHAVEMVGCEVNEDGKGPTEEERKRGWWAPPQNIGVFAPVDGGTPAQEADEKAIRETFKGYTPPRSPAASGRSRSLPPASASRFPTVCRSR